MVYAAERAGAAGGRPHHRPAAGRALTVASSSPPDSSAWWRPASATFYLGLVLLGDGNDRPAEAERRSTIVGQLYARATGAATPPSPSCYMGINLGALISPFACGWVGEKVGWRLGFGLAGRGHDRRLDSIALGRQVPWASRPSPGNPCRPGGGSPGRSTACGASPRRGTTAVGGRDTGALAAAARPSRITAELISDARSGGPGARLGSHFLLAAARPWMVREEPQTFGRDSGSVPVLGVFWFAFEQAGSSLNLSRGQRQPMGAWIPVPASWFQLVQPFFIITLAPAFAWLWSGWGSASPPAPLSSLFACSS